MHLRPETESDIPAMRALIKSAFHDVPHASGSEAEIVDTLRADGALAISLVMAAADDIVGHVAFSPVTIGERTAGWFGLGPLAVKREWRRQGIGHRLAQGGLTALRRQGAHGCVVLGDTAYYARLGFVADPAVTLAGVPAQYFQSLHMTEERPQGEVRYHHAFGTI